MFNISKPKGTPDVSVPIFVFDSADGTPETGYAFNTAGIDLWYRREGGAEVSITEATLASWNAAHSDGGVIHGSDGRGRLDLPDAACAVGTDGATYVEYGGTITGMIVKGGVVTLTDPANEIFTSVVLGATGNTTTTIHVPTWTYGDSEIVDYGIAIKDVDADEWHFRIITNWVNSTKLATVATLPFTPAASTDLVVLLGHFAWNPSWDAEVQSEATDALNAYDPPTKAELDVLGTAALATASALATVDANVDILVSPYISGTVGATSLSTTGCSSDLSAYAANELKGRTIVFTGGTAAGQAAVITAYAVTNGVISFTTVATAPVNADTFVIV